MEYLSKLHKEYQVTIIQVTHDASTTEYSDKIIHLVDGKIKD